jgi:hypothetical protein
MFGIYTDVFLISDTLQSTGCYIRLETSEGFLDSPNYPDNYPPGFDCCYDIARPSSQHCGVKFYGIYCTVPLQITNQPINQPKAKGRDLPSAQVDVPKFITTSLCTKHIDGL